MVAWENIDSVTSRLKVPNGWIVRTLITFAMYPPAVHQVFLEDCNHHWNIHNDEDET